jgi:two-component system NarL family response regulator
VIRVLIADDHPIVRDGLAAVLGDLAGLTVVDPACASAEEAVAALSERRPDVLLLDLEMPGCGGLAALPRLLAASPGTKILVFTAYETEELVRRALESGASGYLLKGASAAEIGQAVAAVHAGRRHVDSRVAGYLLREPAPALSEREREVLRLVAGGSTNGQIGRALGITERTAKFHVRSLFTKLGAESRAHLVAIAAERRLI